MGTPAHVHTHIHIYTHAQTRKESVSKYRGSDELWSTDLYRYPHTHTPSAMWCYYYLIDVYFFLSPGALSIEIKMFK